MYTHVHIYVHTYTHIQIYIHEYWHTRTHMHTDLITHINITYTQREFAGRLQTAAVEDTLSHIAGFSKA